MWHATLRGLLAKKFRLVLTSLAVVMGVAFMTGTFVLTDTLGNVFDDLFATTTEGVDAVVRGRAPYDTVADGSGNSADLRPPVPEELVEVVGSVRGVERAEGNVLGFTFVVGPGGTQVDSPAPNLGTAWYPLDVAVGSGLQLRDGRGPRSPDEVALDVKTAEKLDAEVGDRVRASFTAVAPREFRVVGTFLFGGKEDGLAGATLAAFEPSTAQEVLNRIGTWDQIQVRAAPNLSETQIRDRIRAALRAEGLSEWQTLTGTQLADEQSDDIKDNLQFFNVFLLIFALVALFVGAFIIYNTFSITVAQRTRELGLLRALGASGRQVIGSVAIEALVVGVVSSVLGIVVGIGFVFPLKALIGAMGFALPGGPLQIGGDRIVTALLTGTIVTTVSAVGPARRAARIPPIAALRATGGDGGSPRRRYLWGTAVTGLGVIALFLGLFGSASGNDAAALVGIAAFLVFIGVAMLSPLLARPAARVLAWPARRFQRITGVLAQENAMRNPRRTASTASALMIGLALVTLIAVFGQSAKSSFARAIQDQTRADFILSPEQFQPFSSEVATAIEREMPGSTIVEYRFGSIQLGGDVESVLGASPNFSDMTEVKLRSGNRIDDFEDGGLLIYKDVAADDNLKVGDRVEAKFPLGNQTLTVLGIFEDRRALPGGSDYIVSLANWESAEGFQDALDFFVGVRKPADVSSAEARRVVERIANRFGGIKAEDETEFKDSQLAQFDQILNLMYALLLFAVVIALVGIVNTLALSIYERTREIGLLRAVGMSRVQLRRMVRGEALIVSVFGSLLGLVIGLFFGRAIIEALSSEGITFDVPVGQLVVFVVLAGLAGVLAGGPPGRRAARLDILRAINSE